jgi:photosystem I subunit 3
MMTMRRFLAFVLAIALSFSLMPSAFAQSGFLVPCKDSKAFLERQNQAPDSYYFKQPYQSYSEYLLCGEDGLPHLPLSFDRAVDIVIPFGLFFYVAGFIGWSGRSYLQAANRSNTPEEKEIFIDILLAIQSVIKGLLWPLLFLQELAKGRLTAKETEIYVSPR